jgi:hypothetical protein
MTIGVWIAEIFGPLAEIFAVGALCDQRLEEAARLERRTILRRLMAGGWVWGGAKADATAKGVFKDKRDA